MLGRRVLTGCLAVPVLLLLAADRGWWFLLGIYLAGLVGTAEALRMVRRAGYRPLLPFAFLFTLLLLTDAATAAPGGIGQSLGWMPARLITPAIGVVVLGSLSALLVRTDHTNALLDWALTLALPLYVGGLLQFFIPLRERSDAGPTFLTWPALVLVTSWSCDIAAYFAGRAWGRVRLAPAISPAKSREGALAGLLVATLVGAALALVTRLDPLRMAGFGLAIGLGSVLGDLGESLLKRQCGVKDSGSLMPGHGGLLDRMDALLFSAAAAYFYLQAVM